MRSGAALLWRAPTGLGLPIVKVLADGTYLSVLIDPQIRGARRRAAILAAARAGADLAEEPAHLVRVIEYDIPDRDGNGTGELIVLLSTITDPPIPAPTSSPRPTISGGRRRPETTSSRPTCAAPGGSCAHDYPSWSTRRSGPGCWSTTRSAS
ncbi:MAG: hypothetical protein LC799_09550 [Actinobacteria bacterium]|nr:hypothetical protein [Actinomycetota bacterium]